MPASMSVGLAQGLWKDGSNHRAAVVRPLTGADEASFVDSIDLQSRPDRISALLGATVERIGELRWPGTRTIHELTIGDRERLLLTLYSLTFGRPDISCVAQCSSLACGEQIEFDVVVGNLLASPVAEPAHFHERNVFVAGTHIRVEFRMPTGADQARAGEVAKRDLRQAGLVLLKNCLVVLEDAHGCLTPEDTLVQSITDPLSRALEEIDPLTEARVDLACPACGLRNQFAFDAATFLFAEIRRDDIFGEIDELARCYHWSEAEILTLPVVRRRRYLGLARREGIAV